MTRVLLHRGGFTHLFGAEDAAVTRKGSGRLARWIALSERDVSVWKSRRDGAIHHGTKV